MKKFLIPIFIAAFCFGLTLNVSAGSFPINVATNTVYEGNDINIKTIDGNKFKLLEKTSVPIPAAAWLFGTGLIWLFGIRRKL